MNYQALFTDFDGTLKTSDSDGKISEANIKAINAAKAAGKFVVLCSGRSWQSLGHFEKMMAFNTPKNYGVAFNGGVVYTHDKNGYEILFEQALEKTTANEVIREVKKINLPNVEIFTYGINGDFFAEEHMKGKVPFGELRFITEHYVKDFSKVADEFAKVILFGENGALKTIATQMSKYSPVFSADCLLEFLPPDINKGRGMAFLADYLNIPLKEVIAMGDEENDIPMLKAAGLGIAVANAVTATKASADVVLPQSCHEDAVSVAIHKYLL